MDVANLLAELFGRVDDEVAGAVDGLSADELATAPEPGANTIGWLVWHLTRVQDDHIAELLDGERADLDETGPWAARFGLEPDPDNSGLRARARAGARRPTPSADDLLGYYRAVRARTSAYLATLTADDLDRDRRPPLGSAGDARRAAGQRRRRRDPARRPGGLRPRSARSAVTARRRAGRGEPLALVVAPGRLDHRRVGRRRDGRRPRRAPADRGRAWRRAGSGGRRRRSPVLTAVAITRAWDLAAVHRLLHGGWRPTRASSGPRSHGLDPEAVPVLRPPDLFDPGPAPGELDDPIGADGHLRPEWTTGELGGVARAARPLGGARPRRRVAPAGRDRRAVGRHPQALATAHAESAAELLCVELGADGLPIDRRRRRGDPRRHRRAAARLGRRGRARSGRRATPRCCATPRPARRPTCATRPRCGRCCDGSASRSTDTRAWRLEQLRDTHPLVDALLTWRRIERTATTYGYGWLDEHVARRPAPRARGPAPTARPGG